MKKMLMVASVPSMIGQFNMDNISVLQELGYKVYVACDFKDRSVWDEERTSKFKGELRKKVSDIIRWIFPEVHLILKKILLLINRCIVWSEKKDLIWYIAILRLLLLLPEWWPTNYM